MSDYSITQRVEIMSNFNFMINFFISFKQTPNIITYSNTKKRSFVFYTKISVSYKVLSHVGIELTTLSAERNG